VYTVLLVQCSRKCTPAYLSTGISNLLQLAQPEVVLGQLSTYLASWVFSTHYNVYGKHWYSVIGVTKLYRIQLRTVLIYIYVIHTNKLDSKLHCTK
jgi:hypothetical protein